MKKQILTEEEQKQRIQELMGRLDNNDFDTIKRSGSGYVGDTDDGIETPEIDYDDRDVEPDFFGSDDVEGGFDKYYEEPEDNEYLADFSDDMTMGQDLEYGDKGFDRDDVDGVEEPNDSMDDDNGYDYNEKLTISPNFFDDNKLNSKLDKQAFWEKNFDNKNIKIK